MKINKRKNWYTSHQPHGPSEPTQPNPTTTYRTFQIVHSEYSSELDLSNVVPPVGKSLSDFVIKISVGYCENEPTIDVGYYEERTIPTPRYKQLFKEHQKRMKEHDVKIEAHKAEVEEWKLWCEQCEKEDQERAIKDAEKLLRKHGKLK